MNRRKERETKRRAKEAALYYAENSQPGKGKRAVTPRKREAGHNNTTEKEQRPMVKTPKRTITKGEHECTKVLQAAAAEGLSYGQYVAREHEKRQKEGR